MSAELPHQIDDSIVVAAMSQTLRTPVIAVRPLRGAVGGQNVRLATADGAYTLKMAERGIISTEIWACTWASDHGLLAPEVITADLSGRVLGRSYVVLRWQDGTEPAPRDDAVAEAGRQLSRLHTTAIQGYGRVIVSAVHGEAKGEFETWSEYIESILDKRADLSKNLILDPAVSRAANRALRSVGHDITYTRPGAVLHSDLHLRHFLARHGQLTGILDWADASVGDPIMDLAVLSHDGDETLATFMLGYGLAMSLATRRKLVAYRLLSTIDTLWCEWRTGGDWFDAYRSRIAADTDVLASMT